jgi:sugar phosphate isomerase/epimerase
LYPSIRDDMLTPFDSPLAGLRHLGLGAIELEVTPDLEVYAPEAFTRICLEEGAARTAYKKSLDAAGIRVASLLTMCDFSGKDPESNVAYMSRVAEFAADLGADNVRVDTAMTEEQNLPFGERVDVFVRDLGEVLNRTTGLDVALGMENHGFQGNNLAFLLNVIQGIGSERIGMTLDTGNFYWRGYPLSEVYGILRVLAPHAKHTHLKNINYPKDIREATRESGHEYMQYVSTLEEGDINHGVVVKILHEAGYDGDLCIENESLENHDAFEDKAAVLERDAVHVKGLLG